MVSRLLYTLEKCGMVEKTGENQYSVLHSTGENKNDTGWAMRRRAPIIIFRRTYPRVCAMPRRAEGMEIISVDNH